MPREPSTIPADCIHLIKKYAKDHIPGQKEHDLNDARHAPSRRHKECEAQRILEKGCNGFLQKPFRIADISQKVREVLGN